MPLTKEDEQAVDQALQTWRQGDVCLEDGLEFLHLADLSRPHSTTSVQVAQALASNDEAFETGATPVLDEVRGMAVLSQTCDVVRGCQDRPFVEVAPLIEVPASWIEAVRRLKRPAFAYVPATAGEHLVADLDRTMTVEKALISRWPRTPGWIADDDLRNFARALSRKRSRFAFPDDFVKAARNLHARLVDKHRRQTNEGAHLRALREIRVRAAPSWSDGEVHLSWWFIKETDPADVPVDWPNFVDSWLGFFNHNGRFHLDSSVACRLEDMTARDYVESDPLDLDLLSLPDRHQELGDRLSSGALSQ